MPSASYTIPNLVSYVLDERYELLSVLGSGSYGVVYKALDLKPNSPSDAQFRAIKIVCKANRRPTQLEAVRREVELQSLVTGHPNIVGILDAFEDTNYFYLVLELCPGGDLFHQICSKRSYAGNDARLRRVFLQLVDAVEACHQRNIFHRDLKPDNILSNVDGSEIFLGDFGLATERTVANECGCGTQAYMSPEVISKNPYCTRFADIWALGVILVNMICGRHPWSIATPEDYCFAKWLADPNYLKQMLPISPGANNILLRIFQLEPLKRITLADLRKDVASLDTFFLSREELAVASDFAQYVAADLYWGYERRGHYRMRVPIPAAQPIHLPEARDITSRTETDPRTPIARQPSFMAQPKIEMPAPQGLFVAKDGDYSSGSDQTDSSGASSSSFVQRVDGAIKVGLEIDIAEAVLNAPRPERADFSPVPFSHVPVYG
ncbi:kinase-like protein [Dichomitus squalens]|uniref:Kinase-like protein n=1 Tax=Dichomitus squalens TaxID=114155 RepID=A0A4Q9QB49_9APHY|nr:kinase-like protein [Dichomitus squalens]